MKLLSALLIFIFIVSCSPSQERIEPQQPIAIGSRLQLFVDDYLIEELSGGARLVLQHPIMQDVAIVHDERWEGNGSGFHSVFQDGDLYRMYYKAWQLTTKNDKLTIPHPLFTCYAESDDGIHWRKPHLELVEFKWSMQNNILWADNKSVDAGHPAVFIDTNPDAPPEERYKAIRVSGDFNGLMAFKSPDGIHWTAMSDKNIVSKSDLAMVESGGFFDSQNTAFWDSAHEVYRLFFRFWPNNRRDIMTMSSKDFLNWIDPLPLEYPGARPEHLYTNQIKPYYRAPHILVGFPIRYIDRGWTDSTKALPEFSKRRQRAGPLVDIDGDELDPRFGSAVTESLLMTSRDGHTFKRWDDAFLRPGIERKHSWAYGNQYIAWHLVETKSKFEEASNELSLYATEGYWTGTSNQLRRYTLRIDGFVSVKSPLSGGELLTKPLIFEGDEMVMNFSTSAAGSIQVEIQNELGAPIEGYALADCLPVFGDSIERKVNWSVSSNLGELAGQPVRLRFVCKDADLYSFHIRSRPYKR